MGTLVARRLCKSLVFIALLTASVHSQAQDQFELEYEVTLEHVEQSYQELIQEIPELRRSGYKVCGRRREVVPCVFIRNFPLSMAASKLTEGSIYRRNYSWVPSSKALGGDRAVALWKQQAASRRIFGCRGSNCKIIVNAPAPEPEVAVLAKCNITKIGNTLGAPNQCTPIAVITPNRTLLEVIYAIGKSTALRALRRQKFDLMMVYPPRVKVSAIKDVLRQALSKPPLDYSIESGGNTITGTASYRVSPVLSPYREMVTTSIDMLERGVRPRYLGMRITIDLYVNRYNTTRPRDWRLPDDQQESKYVKAVKALIKSSLEMACQVHHWRDENILLCELPKDTPVDDLIRFYLR